MSKKETYVNAVVAWAVDTMAALMPEVTIHGINLGTFKYAAPLVAAPVKKRVDALVANIEEDEITTFVDQFVQSSIEHCSKGNTVDIMMASLDVEDFKNLKSYLDAVKTNQNKKGIANDEK